MTGDARRAVAAANKDDYRLKATRAVLADRERELLELKGPCSTCRLHYAHSGPCDMASQPAPCDECETNGTNCREHSDTVLDKNQAEIANQQVSGSGGADTAEPADDAGGEVERIMALVLEYGETQGCCTAVDPADCRHVMVELNTMAAIRQAVTAVVAERCAAERALRDALSAVEQAHRDRDERLTLEESGRLARKYDDAIAERDQARICYSNALVQRDQARAERNESMTQLDEALAEAARLRSERDEARAEVERMRPVVEAAREWHAAEIGPSTLDTMAGAELEAEIAAADKDLDAARLTLHDAVREYDATSSTGRTDTREDGRE